MVSVCSLWGLAERGENTDLMATGKKTERDGPAAVKNLLCVIDELIR